MNNEIRITEKDIQAASEYLLNALGHLAYAYRYEDSAKLAESDVYNAIRVLTNGRLYDKIVVEVEDEHSQE